MKGDTSMEIIIRMEEKENPTVGAALCEMASNAWVKTYLPQCIEQAKIGKTQMSKYFDKSLYSEQNLQVVAKAFSSLDIQVKFWTNYNFSKPHWEVTFYWN